MEIKKARNFRLVVYVLIVPFALFLFISVIGITFAQSKYTSSNSYNKNSYNRTVTRTGSPSPSPKVNPNRFEKHTATLVKTSRPRPSSNPYRTPKPTKTPTRTVTQTAKYNTSLTPTPNNGSIRDVAAICVPHTGSEGGIICQYTFPGAHEYFVVSLDGKGPKSKIYCQTVKEKPNLLYCYYDVSQFILFIAELRQN